MPHVHDNNQGGEGESYGALYRCLIYVKHAYCCIYVSLFLNDKIITSKFEIFRQTNHNSLAFRVFIEGAVASGWLRLFDVLVGNNAAIYEKGYNIDLADY